MSDARPILARYTDPLDVIWLACCKQLGLTIRRHPDVFSMTEGDGVVWLGNRDTLDADDTLAQMVLHEICHWITSGINSVHERDWGFPLEPVVPDVREHGCLRLQTWLTGQHGLRVMLAPTGDFRPYYNRIPATVLAPIPGQAGEDQAIALARAGIERAQQDPWAQPLTRALRATAALKALVQPFLGHYTTEHPGDVLPSLWAV